MDTHIFFWNFFIFLFAAQALDVLGFVCLNIIHAMDFGSSEHREGKVYEVYTLSMLGVWYPSELDLPVISGWSR